MDKFKMENLSLPKNSKRMFKVGSSGKGKLLLMKTLRFKENYQEKKLVNKWVNFNKY